MFTVTRFCVQEYLSTSAGIRAGEVREFRELEDATRHGRQVGGRRVGAVIYKAVGEPPSNLWRDPELIESVGYVPPSALDLFRPLRGSAHAECEIIAFVARKAG